VGCLTPPLLRRSSDPSTPTHRNPQAGSAACLRKRWNAVADLLAKHVELRTQARGENRNPSVAVRLPPVWDREVATDAQNRLKVAHHGHLVSALPAVPLVLRASRKLPI
jgi:hypothetical protein